MRAADAQRRRSTLTRLVTAAVSTLLISGLVIGVPMLGGGAEDPKPVSPAVQDIALGNPDAPAKDVKVLDASKNPAPTPKAPTPSADPSAAPQSAEPTSPSSDSAAPTPSESQAAPTTTEPAPSATEPAPSATEPAPSTTEPAPSATEAPTPQTQDLPKGTQTMVLAQKDTNGFSTVGVSWVGDTPDTGLAVQIRTKDTETGTWAEWTDLTVNQDVAPNAAATNQRTGTDPYWFGTSNGIEVSFSVAPGVSISDAKVTLIDPKKISQDGNPGAPQPADEAHGAAGDQPQVYTRAQWGADESKMGWDPQYASTIKAATLHHSADGNNYSAADVPGMMRSIYQYQAVTLHWGDIGYNVVVDKFGRAWEGRSGGLASTVIGAHAGGFNTYTFGVSMLGNYDLVDVPAAVKETVAQLIAWKFSLYNVNPTGWTQLTQMNGGFTTAKFNDGQVVSLPTIFGHRDVGNTVCPGRYGYATLPWIRTRAAEIIAQIKYVDPQGAMQASVDAAGTIKANGWAFDLSTPYSPVTVMFTVNGQVAGFAEASGPRPELAYYGVPGNHGFVTSFPATSGGDNQVCMYVFNTGGGNNIVAACQTVKLPQINPRGAMAVSMDAAGNINANGWAFDLSQPSTALNVMFTSNGQVSLITNANGPRPELANYGIPGNHGFNLSYKAPVNGDNQVCMYVFNVGGGVNILAGCQTVSPPVIQPRGAMAVSASAGKININGWAFDLSEPDNPVNVMFTTNGQVTQIISANGPRPELAYYGIPGNHGFVTSYAAPKSGSNQVCMFVFNLGGGDNQLASCTTVKV